MGHKSGTLVQNGTGHRHARSSWAMVKPGAQCSARLRQHSSYAVVSESAIATEAPRDHIANGVSGPILSMRFEDILHP